MTTSNSLSRLCKFNYWKCFTTTSTIMDNVIVATLTLTICALLTAGSHLNMPSFSFTGESVTLECIIDHGDLPILSITWTKDGDQFYKYDPNNQVPVTIFNVTGVQVKKDLSLNGNKITIGSIALESAGVYSCNVQIDHPSLNAGEMSGTLKVVQNF